MKRALFVLSLVLGSGCSRIRTPSAASPSSAMSDRCDVVLAALTGSYQVGGVDLDCVRRETSVDGNILVDAVFEVPVNSGALEPLAIPDCVHPPYVVRYDYARQGSATTGGVVSVAILAPAAGKIGFSIGVDRAGRKKRQSNHHTISPCGSASGTLTRSDSKWTALLDLDD